MKKNTTNNRVRFWIDKKEQLSLTGISIFLDWMLLLGIAFIITCGLIAWSSILHEDVFSRSVLEKHETSMLQQRIDEALLEQTTMTIKQKQELFTKQTEGFVFSDTAQDAVISVTGTATTTGATTTTP